MEKAVEIKIDEVSKLYSRFYNLFTFLHLQTETHMNTDPRYIKPKDRPKPGRGEGGGFLHEVNGDLISIKEIARRAGKSVNFTRRYLTEGSVKASDFIERFSKG